MTSLKSQSIQKRKGLPVSFDRAFEIVIGAEGGYSNDPKDRGGETKYGISKRAYPYLDIPSLTLDDAKRIYRRDYWEFVVGDALPWPLNCFVFDAAVNQGVSPAIRLLQTALGVEDDGVIGPQTISAVGKFPLSEICTLYLALRGMRYSSTAAFERYGKGWLKRLFLALWKATV